MNHFWIGFEKQAQQYREVATIAVVHGDKTLMGKRRDNNRFTTPGGHLEKGETPIQGAIRELFEESNIKAKPSQLKRTKSETVHLPDGKALRVHGYRMDVKTPPNTSMKNDPDNEVYRWSWVPYKPFPKEIAEKMHVKWKDNVLWKGIGAQLPEGVKEDA